MELSFVRYKGMREGAGFIIFHTDSLMIWSTTLSYTKGPYLYWSVAGISATGQRFVPEPVSHGLHYFTTLLP